MQTRHTAKAAAKKAAARSRAATPAELARIRATSWKPAAAAPAARPPPKKSKPAPAVSKPAAPHTHKSRAPPVSNEEEELRLALELSRELADHQEAEAEARGFQHYRDLHHGFQRAHGGDYADLDVS